MTFKKHAPLAIVVVLLSLAGIEILDYVTGPVLDLSIAYFVPIVLAALALGRFWAFVTVLLAEVPSIADQTYLLRIGETSLSVAISNAIVRLAVFSFVVEATWRLVNAREQMRQVADELGRTTARLRSLYERLDEDVKAAGLLQAGVLSFAPPAVPGVSVGASIRYAGPTGGDLADAGMLGDRVYACVADVSGKGVPAALFTTLLKHLLLDGRDQGLHAADLVTSLNHALYRVLPAEYFVTLLYAEVEPRNGRVVYVNAGHPEGLVYRVGTDRLEEISPTASLLGVYTGIAVGMKELDLHNGDTLVLYTDGATDSRTPQGSRLGEDAIRDLVRQYHHLPAQTMADSIRQSIESSTDERKRDDLAILCIRYNRP